MKIRKVKLLYTLKTENGYIPGGIYDADSPKGIPKAVLKEVERKRSTVQVLVYEEDKIEEKTEEEYTTMIYDASTDLQTEEEEAPRKRSRRKPA
jgi:hypothetical protein